MSTRKTIRRTLAALFPKSSGIEVSVAWVVSLDHRDKAGAMTVNRHTKDASRNMRNLAAQATLALSGSSAENTFLTEHYGLSCTVAVHVSDGGGKLAKVVAALVAHAIETVLLGGGFAVEGSSVTKRKNFFWCLISSRPYRLLSLLTALGGTGDDKDGITSDERHLGTRWILDERIKCAIPVLDWSNVLAPVI